jgi:hypothetical protein
VGVINHSGESVLRASNPAHTTMARLRKRSSRTRRRLRQASKVLATHPATNHKTKAANHKTKAGNRRTKAANRKPKARSRTKGHRRGSHRRKRRARGSRKSKTSK